MDEQHISTTTGVQLRNKHTSNNNNAKDDQLNKCISELSSSFRRCASETAQESAGQTQNVPTSTTPTTTSNSNKLRPEARPASMATASSTPSHFVTVIEVKESVKKKAAVVVEEQQAVIATEESEDDRLDEGVPGEQGMVAKGNEEEEETTGQTNTTDDESLAETRGVQRNKSSDSSGFGSDGQSNVMRLINRNNAALAASTVTTTTSAVANKSSTFSANNNGDKIIGLLSSQTAGADQPKKRIPPR